MFCFQFSKTCTFHSSTTNNLFLDASAILKNGGSTFFKSFPIPYKLNAPIATKKQVSTSVVAFIIPLFSVITQVQTTNLYKSPVIFTKAPVTPIGCSTGSIGIPAHLKGCPVMSIGIPAGSIGIPAVVTGNPKITIGYAPVKIGIPAVIKEIPFVSMEYPLTTPGYPASTKTYSTEVIESQTRIIGSPTRSIGYPKDLIGTSRTSNTLSTLNRQTSTDISQISFNSVNSLFPTILITF